MARVPCNGRCEQNCSHPIFKHGDSRATRQSLVLESLWSDRLEWFGLNSRCVAVWLAQFERPGKDVPTNSGASVEAIADFRYRGKMQPVLDSSANLSVEPCSAVLARWGGFTACKSSNRRVGESALSFEGICEVIWGIPYRENQEHGTAGCEGCRHFCSLCKAGRFPCSINN
jgi:hypothetical protein